MLVLLSHVMDKNEFQQSMQSGLGRAIIYAHENDVRAFRDIILDACLHCYSVDVQTEGTRAGYMLELVNLLGDRQFYCDKVLEALAEDGDDWDTAQRFHFATYMAFDGDERAHRLIYETFAPGPKMGEAIAIDFVRLDGLKGFLFAAAKLGALMISRPNEVDEGWLWSQAIEICGEDNVKAALSQAAATDPGVEAYRLAAVAHEHDGSSRSGRSEKLTALTYEQLRPKMPGLRGFWLSSWGKQAREGELERAARGLAAIRNPEEQIQHLRIFSRKPFPLDPSLLFDLSSSANPDLAYAAIVALPQLEHPSLREIAFRLVRNRLVGRQWAIAMLDRNWESGDHEIVMSWLEAESDRDTRHHMQSSTEEFWEHHPEPASEVRMLYLSYENGPCSFCRESVVRRLIELDALTTSLRVECAHDANDEIRKLVAPA
jgi:hypothetical protein